VVGAIAKPALGRDAAREHLRDSAPAARRPVYFDEAGGYVECPIYDRYRLGPEAVVDGPAVVEEFDSTTVIHPGYRARADAFGHLHVSRAEGPAAGR